MLVKLNPNDKKVFMDNLTKAGFQFTTEPARKTVVVEVQDIETLLKLTEVEDK